MVAGGGGTATQGCSARVRLATTMRARPGSTMAPYAAPWDAQTCGGTRARVHAEVRRRVACCRMGGLLGLRLGKALRPRAQLSAHLQDAQARCQAHPAGVERARHHKERARARDAARAWGAWQARSTVGVSAQRVATAAVQWWGAC